SRVLSSGLTDESRRAPVPIGRDRGVRTRIPRRHKDFLASGRESPSRRARTPTLLERGSPRWALISLPVVPALAPLRAPLTPAAFPCQEKKRCEESQSRSSRAPDPGCFASGDLRLSAPGIAQDHQAARAEAEERRGLGN